MITKTMKLRVIFLLFRHSYTQSRRESHLSSSLPRTRWWAFSPLVSVQSLSLFQALILYCRLRNKGLPCPAILTAQTLSQSNLSSSSRFSACKCQINPLHKTRVIARHRRARRLLQSRLVPMSNKLLVDYFRQNRSKCPTPTLQHQTLLIVSVMSLVH